MATIIIEKINTASAENSKSNPPVLTITASGDVPTSGYTNPGLVPRMYTVQPPDGIWEFDFMVDEPEGPVNEVITEQTASFAWEDYPKGLKGVRIYGSKESKDVLVGHQ